MITYINVFMGIIPRHSGGLLQYSNLCPGFRDMININILIYVIMLLSSYVANILPVRPTANTVCRDTRDGVDEARVPYALTSRC